MFSSIYSRYNDHDFLAEITDELEHYGAKTVPNQRDLNTFRQQLNEALDQDFDIRKTALHTLIRKIEVDGLSGVSSFKFDIITF